MFRQFEIFRLIKALPDGSVPIGTTGAVLEVFGGEPREYEVEFPDGNGGNLGRSITYTISEEFMLPCPSPINLE
jgi:hypothetical protein